MFKIMIHRIKSVLTEIGFCAKDVESVSQDIFDAYTSAERAEQAANNAGYMDIEMVEGRLIYTRTDAVDVTFELDDGHLLMEVI